MHGFVNHLPSDTKNINPFIVTTDSKGTKLMDYNL